MIADVVTQERIRELEDKLAGAVEVLNGAGVKMCELIDQLTEYKEAVRVLGKCIEARRREKVTREGFHRVHSPTHTHHQWTRAIEDRFSADNAVDANPIAMAAIEGSTG